MAVCTNVVAVGKVPTAGIDNPASEYHFNVPTGVLETVRVLSPPEQIVLLEAVGAGGAVITCISTKVST